MKVNPPEKASSDWSYDDPDYWDAAKLERELRRVGDVCHQCRRCLPLCPSFPKLFDLVDASDEEIAGVSEAGFNEVNELCFHCKLCYNHCPYTAPHDWDVDFPALMRRQQLVRSRKQGVPLARKLTTRTDLIGKVGSNAPALMNFANRNRLSRVAMEKTIGIHRDWIQPSYQFETIDRWWKKRGLRNQDAEQRVVLFTTCSVNYNDPLTGRAAVDVLEHSGLAVDLSYEGCCGMPFTDTGDLDSARRFAQRNVDALLPFVDAGQLVAIPGPSCSLLFKTEYPKLLGTPEAQRVADASRDLMELLVELGRAKQLNRDFTQPLGKVAYHAPCHLRAQNVGFPSRALLKLAGAEVEVVDNCSGVDGTWGMQARNHKESLKVAEKMLGRIDAASADHIATDCPLAGLRVEEGLGRKPVHPVVLLRHAYGIAPS